MSLINLCIYYKIVCPVLINTQPKVDAGVQKERIYENSINDMFENYRTS